MSRGFPRLAQSKARGLVTASPVAAARSTRTGVLRRCLRDINAGAQHLMVRDSAYERLGQKLLGFPDVDPMG